MESKLFNHIRDLESREPTRVRRAMVQTEELLMDLHTDATLRHNKSKELAEFINLQDNFALNLTGRLVNMLDMLLKSARSEDSSSISDAVAALRLVQGLCLVHRPSRLVFKNRKLLKILIDCLRHEVAEIQTAVIGTLVSVMVRQVEIIRLFEELGGIAVVCEIFKNRLTPKQVKLSILEFLFFYLIPETKRRGAQRAIPRKTTEEKQKVLGKYLSNVDGLVRELELSRPFGSMDLEW